MDNGGDKGVAAYTWEVFAVASRAPCLMTPLLNQAFSCESVPPEVMDRLWAAGWRHFGESFFRYNVSMDSEGVKEITPLRLNLEDFRPSKSQRRVLNRNRDLRHEFAPATLSHEARAMFHRHKGRFRENMPDELETFLSATPGSVPCECLECRVFDGSELVALSYLDLGGRATSSVYGMFEPVHSKRSLGIYTMLLEIEYSRRRGCAFYYPGYATREPSAYDYKKQFQGLEVLNWETGAWGK